MDIGFEFFDPKPVTSSRRSDCRKRNLATRLGHRAYELADSGSQDVPVGHESRGEPIILKDKTAKWVGRGIMAAGLVLTYPLSKPIASYLIQQVHW